MNVDCARMYDRLFQLLERRVEIERTNVEEESRKKLAAVQARFACGNLRPSAGELREFAIIYSEEIHLLAERVWTAVAGLVDARPTLDTGGLERLKKFIRQQLSWHTADRIVGLKDLAKTAGVDNPRDLSRGQKLLKNASVKALEALELKVDEYIYKRQHKEKNRETEMSDEWSTGTVGQFKVRYRFLEDPEGRYPSLGWYVKHPCANRALKYCITRGALQELGVSPEQMYSAAGEKALRKLAEKRAVEDMEALERGEQPAALNEIQFLGQSPVSTALPLRHDQRLVYDRLLAAQQHTPQGDMIAVREIARETLGGNDDHAEQVITELKNKGLLTDLGSRYTFGRVLRKDQDPLATPQSAPRSSPDRSSGSPANIGVDTQKEGARNDSSPRASSMVTTESRDVFICHASEDKDAVARPLATELSRRGFTVWYDEFVLKLGDSLPQEIDRGLASSRFGVVILSPDFFAKNWPRRELDALAAREVGSGQKVILPVWHQVDRKDVENYSPTLGSKLAVSTNKGMGTVVDKIVEVLGQPVRKQSTRAGRSVLANVAERGEVSVVGPKEQDAVSHPEAQDRLRVLRKALSGIRDHGLDSPEGREWVSQVVTVLSKLQQPNDAWHFRATADGGTPEADEASAEQRLTLLASQLDEIVATYDEERGGLGGAKGERGHHGDLVAAKAAADIRFLADARDRKAALDRSAVLLLDLCYEAFRRRVCEWQEKGTLSATSTVAKRDTGGGAFALEYGFNYRCPREGSCAFEYRLWGGSTVAEVAGWCQVEVPVYSKGDPVLVVRWLSTAPSAPAERVLQQSASGLVKPELLKEVQALVEQQMADVFGRTMTRLSEEIKNRSPS